MLHQDGRKPSYITRLLVLHDDNNRPLDDQAMRIEYFILRNSYRKIALRWKETELR